jgi:putative iron-regulated protein
MMFRLSERPLGRCIIGMLFASLMSPTTSALAADISAEAVVENYANIAEATYGDAQTTAAALQGAVARLVSSPSDATLAAARDAWKAARPSYMQTEAFRFGNAIVDDWEGQINSWPLDEGLIDYVAGAYGTESGENEFYAANVIANKSLKVNGKTVDTTYITEDLISKTLHEAGGIEANVATGYHAIEFLLWGQDLNGTGPGAGNRPATDFNVTACTNGNCDRRAAYLSVATDKLVKDLNWMTAQWGKDGAARKAVTDDPDGAGITAIVTGLGSMSYGELAGDRMKLGVMVHDPEEEHDCFSDNTHNSHYYDAIGLQNVYLGRYKRRDGSVVEGASLSAMIKLKAPDADERMQKALAATIEKMSVIKARAEGGEAYDQMIGEGNDEGNAVVMAAVNALVAQAKELERGVAALGIKSVKFEGSDSLDKPGAVPVAAGDKG